MIVSIKSRVQEKFKFLYKFIYSPGQIGSVTPSSKYLARKMIEPVQWNKLQSVAELGAGTGAITKYIQLSRMGKTKVLLFEKDPIMQQGLANKFPHFP